MGQQVSVETFTSSTDTDGNKYWASFDPYPFKVGHRKLAYLGILNGEGPLKGQKCVVKTKRRNVINRKDWMLEKKRAQLVREIANDYNTTVSEREKKIGINGPVIAEIDTLSDCMCLNDLIGKPRKKFKEAEYVSMELYLRGRFENFEYGWVNERDLMAPEAFSHFSWCHSEGKLLVSNLQGVKTSRMYHFTGPVIHSEDREFGNSDIGIDGIKGFFKLHQCNRICQSWPRLGSGVDLRGWGKYVFGKSELPSAPPLPAPPPYEQEYRSMDLAPGFQEQQELVPSSQRPEPWLSSMNQHGVVFDWREELMYQNMVLGQSRRFESPVMLNPMFDSQFMWVVKQMSYTFYNQPPPYYLTEGDRERSNGHRDTITDSDVTSGEHVLNYYAAEDDNKYLLPPPYSEESVDPQYECVTYL